MNEVKQNIINQEVLNTLKETPITVKQMNKTLDIMVKKGTLTQEEKDNAINYVKKYTEEYKDIAMRFRKAFIVAVVEQTMNELEDILD